MPTDIEPAQNLATMEKRLDSSQVQETQLFQLHQLRELEEQVHVIIEPKAQDIVPVEDVAQTQASKHGQNGLGNDVLVPQVDVAEVQAGDFQTVQAKVSQVEVSHAEA